MPSLDMTFCTGTLDEIDCNQRDTCVLYLIPKKIKERGEEAIKPLSMINPPSKEAVEKSCPWYYKALKGWGLTDG